MNNKCSISNRFIATRSRALYLGLCALGIAVAASAGERSPRFITFDAPGAGATAGQGTGCFYYPMCSVVINDSGATTGYYLDSNNVYHGFVRSPGGRIGTFDAPGADTTAGVLHGTLPYAINDEGVITGFYVDANQVSHGFLRDRAGAFTTFDVPGGPLYTIPVALNLEGSVVGSVQDANSVWHGFVRGSDGSFTTIDGPSACNSTWYDGCNGTGALSINAFGEISGGYWDNNAVLHGLVRSPKGVLTTFDAPGAGTTSGQGTSCLDCSAPLNQFGAIAGYYIDGSDVVHGFLRSPAGKITTFDAPAGASSLGFGCFQACPLGLNDSGEVTGVYADTSYVYHGFLRSPRGKITTFDAPGAANGTFPVSINDRGAIAGYYLDANNVYHAFLRLPADD